MTVHKGHEGQYGKVASFLLVGLVLAIIAAGGIYSLQQRDSGKEAAPETSKSPEQSKSEKDKKKTESSESSKESRRDKDMPRSGSSHSAGLPETGPEDAIMPIVAAGLLAGSMVAYFRSFRLAREYSKR